MWHYDRPKFCSRSLPCLKPSDFPPPHKGLKHGRRKSKGCNNHQSSKATQQRNSGSLLQRNSISMADTDNMKDCIYYRPYSTVHVQNDWFTVRPGLCQSKPFRQQEDGTDQAKMKHACHEGQYTKIRSRFLKSSLLNWFQD